MRISDWSSDVCSSDLGTQSRRVESIFGQPADLVILDHHIGIGEQGAQFRLPLGARDVDCHPPLAAVAAVIIGRAQIIALFARNEGRSTVARVVSRARPLDFGDRKSKRLNSRSLTRISYAAFCLKQKYNI